MPFDFNKEYKLENDNVALIPLQASDYDHLVYFSKHEPELWNYSLVRATPESGLKNYLSLAMEGRKNQKEYPFIVYDKVNKQFAGSTRFYDIQLSNKCLQLGFTWYGKQFQRTGLNQHCKYLILQFAFEEMEMERVEFRADNDNKKSITAMKSIGCVEEGILRSNGYRYTGERRDSIVLSILKDEWFSTVKEALIAKCKPITKR